MTVERSAEEWGRVAVSLSGWRWMPGMRNDRGGRLVVGDESARRTPDPDDPATAGCLLVMLGPGASINATGGRVTAWLRVAGARVEGSGTDIGRACIAAAETLGRWPGGDL